MRTLKNELAEPIPLDQAKKLRAEESFMAAEGLYRQLWSEKPNAFTGSSLIYCLRKSSAYD